MQVIKCFEVMGHTDTTEGRGPMTVVARFSNYESAVGYIKSIAYSKYSNWRVVASSTNLANWRVEGCDIRDDIKETTLIILDCLSELRVVEREDLKAKALAKLTKAEREALGL